MHQMSTSTHLSQEGRTLEPKRPSLQIDDSHLAKLYVLALLSITLNPCPGPSCLYVMCLAACMAEK